MWREKENRIVSDLGPNLDSRICRLCSCPAVAAAVCSPSVAFVLLPVDGGEKHQRILLTLPSCASLSFLILYPPSLVSAYSPDREESLSG